MNKKKMRKCSQDEGRRGEKHGKKKQMSKAMAKRRAAYKKKGKECAGEVSEKRRNEKRQKTQQERQRREKVVWQNIVLRTTEELKKVQVRKGRSNGKKVGFM
jgi:hypothetical protein